MRRSHQKGAVVVAVMLAWPALFIRADDQATLSNRPASIEPDAAALLVFRQDTPHTNSPPAATRDTKSAAPNAEPHQSTAAPPDGVAPPAAGEAAAPLPIPIPPQEHRPLGPAPEPDARGNGGIAPVRPDTSNGSWLLSTAAALAIVVALIYATRHAFQRFTGASTGPTINAGLVQVLARTSLGPRTSLLFLRIDQRILVVAQSPTGFQSLTEITDPDEAARLIAKAQAARPLSISTGFRSLLGRFDRTHDAASGHEIDTLDSTPLALADEEGCDQAEHLVDRTRNELSELRSRIRLLRTSRADA